VITNPPGEVLETVCGIIREVLELAEADIDIAPPMSLTDDVGLESIDLVNIGSMLMAAYGPEVNLASHLAELEIDDVIALTVADLVAFVTRVLADHVTAGH
jgi:acyl carrier protein